MSDRNNINKDSSWWKKASKSEKLLIVETVVCALLALLLLIVLIRTLHSTENHPEICTTPGCVIAATKILSKMDKSINPCENFYDFVCGNFIKTTIIPEDKTDVDQLGRLNDDLKRKLRPLLEAKIKPNEPKPFQIMKTLYKSCMDTETIKEIGTRRLKDFLREAGGWPVIEGNWNHSKFNWVEAIIKMRKIGFNTNQFLSFAIRPKLKASNEKIIELNEAYLGISREYLVKGLNNTIVKAYYEYMTKVAIVFGANEYTAKRELLESLNFEIKLANCTTSREEHRNISQSYNPMKISELQQIYPSIKWLQYINRMLHPFQKLSADEIVNVDVPEFITKLENLISETPKRVQANYFFWRIVAVSVRDLTDELRKLQLAFAKIVWGISTRPARWKECFSYVTNKMNVPAGSLYISEHFDEATKKDALEIVQDIRKEFLQILQDIDWMDEKTKEKAIEKATAMSNHIGYPEELKNITKIEELYDGLEINEDDFLGSQLNITDFEKNVTMKNFRKPVKDDRWIQMSYILTANAYYSSSDNSIEFPAAILQGEFFDRDRPRYMNYGALGFVIGHEITHGFDDKGRQEDKDGNLVDWWEPKTKDLFEEKAQCIVDQYGSYVVPELTENEEEIHLNGITTQGETIADNGGIKQAYRAYEKWVERNGQEPTLPGLSDYTPNQLFWMSSANAWCEKSRLENLKARILTQSHPPFSYRILGAFSNMEQFSKDFNCESGSAMNPIKKCSVW